jgi:Phosphotransferase enzyme family
MTILIMSSAYVGNEMRSEFGVIPPTFLPTGAGCLYEQQFAALPSDAARYLTLPSGFELPKVDAERFEELDITPLFLSESAALTEALTEAIGMIVPAGPLRVLFGDTLVTMTDAQQQLTDSIAIQVGRTSHDWLYVDPETMAFSDHPVTTQGTGFVSCGYYAFSDPACFVRHAKGASLSEALSGYANETGLTCFEPESWLDFGHVSLFYQSKKDLLVSRAFNSVTVHDNVLSKFSADTRKMRAEANWFRALPADLALHCPRFMGETSRGGRAGYSLEYMYLPTLSDLFTHGRLPPRNWSRILRGTADFLDQCRNIRPDPAMPEAHPDFAARFFDDLICKKSRERLDLFLGQNNIDAQQEFVVNGKKFPPLHTILSASIKQIDPTRTADICFWHGDLFFGNMLYDARSERIICLDPRGLVGSDFSVYGDLRYDLAKLAHSIYGRYDFIIGNRYHLTAQTPFDITFRIDRSKDHAEICEVFKTEILDPFGMSEKQALALCSVLFLSMLPLHADNEKRQLAFVATALQCFDQWRHL